MLNTVAQYLRCPHCRGETSLRERSLVCPAGHSFDVAKQGYVNLLPHASAHSADSQEMVAARAAFLDAGHYAPLSAALAALARRTAPEPLPGCVVDVGGGTGHHQARVMEEFPGADGVLLDVSKFAARRAARAHPRIGAVVADAWRELPLRDGAAGVVLNTFAPRNGPELRRILDPRGVLLVVTPEPGHLQELTGALGLMRVDERKEERLADRLSPYFSVAVSERLTSPMTLDHAALALLVGMGPNARHLAGEELARRVAALPPTCEVTLSVTLTAYRPLA
ncbi:MULTISPECIES: putative RNA methyltransferase [Streptomyces]|uniref:Methyltransferase domain-containing protein n=1 Tax=Streptomyces luteosporeus TaxID=173856 RepID=A0ABN3TME0_9ACTN